MNTDTFVIYSSSNAVLGYVEHVNGDRAVAKAEDVTGKTDLLWNKWENATPAERNKARLLGSIT